MAVKLEGIHPACECDHGYGSIGTCLYFLMTHTEF